MTHCDPATLFAVRSALARAADVWDDQTDRLRHARLALADADPGPLGPRVAPAAAAYLERWADRLDGLARAACTHSEGLLGLWTCTAAVDDDTAQRLGRGGAR